MSLYKSLTTGNPYVPPRSSPDRRKLTADNVDDIRHLYRHCGWSQKQLAEQFNVSQGHISKVIRKLQWKDPK